MVEIGTLLKQTREKKGLTLRDVEEATKIRYKYLEALEEDNFKILPGTVYTKGFIRNYANFLGLDGNPLLEVYNETNFDPEEKPKPGPVVQYNQKRTLRITPRFWRLVLVIGAVATLLLFKVFYQPAQPEKLPEKAIKPKVNIGEQGKKVPQNIPAPTTPVPSSPPDQTPPPVVTGVNLVLTATRGNSWVRVYVDGAFQFEGTITTGTSKTFQGNSKITVKFGNAPAISVTSNGQNLGNVGGGKTVFTKDFTAVNPD